MDERTQSNASQARVRGIMPVTGCFSVRGLRLQKRLEKNTPGVHVKDRSREALRRWYRESGTTRTLFVTDKISNDISLKRHPFRFFTHENRKRFLKNCRQICCALDCFGKRRSVCHGIVQLTRKAISDTGVPEALFRGVVLSQSFCVNT